MCCKKKPNVLSRVFGQAVGALGSGAGVASSTLSYEVFKSLMMHVIRYPVI